MVGKTTDRRSALWHSCPERPGRRGGGMTLKRLPAVGLLLLAGLITVLGTGVLLMPRLLFPSLSGAQLSGVADARARIELQQAQAKLQNDARSALLQGFAGLLVVVGALATWRQVTISREGQ